MNDKDTQLIYEAYRQHMLEEGIIDDIKSKAKQLGLSALLVAAVLGYVEHGKMERRAQIDLENKAKELETSNIDMWGQLGINPDNLPPLPDSAADLPPLPGQLPPVGPPPDHTGPPVADNNATNAQFFDMLRANEGLRLEAYRDTNNNWTIGIGHHLDESQEDRNAVAGALTNANLPAVNYDNLIARTEQITEDQARAIFDLDLEHHLAIARDLVPAFNNLPGYLQLALGDMAFRTDLQQSPNAQRAMNANNWNTAADQYLNSDEYRQSQRTGTGIAPRMDRNAAAMRRYAEELEAQQNNR